VNSGDVSLAAVGSSPNANGATLTGQVLALQPASGTQPGVVSTGAQTFAGAKTFSSTVGASNLSGTNTGDVSLGAAGSSPNANGATLTGQVLTLQLADTSNPGLIGPTANVKAKTMVLSSTGDEAVLALNSSASFRAIGFAQATTASVVAPYISSSGGNFTIQPAGGQHIDLGPTSGNYVRLINTGARLKLSTAGTVDYLSSNGSDQITAAGKFNVTDTLTTNAVVGIVMAGTGRMYWSAGGNYMANHGASGLFTVTSGWRADVASGNAFLINTAGARLAFSVGGTTDYLFGDGATIVKAAGKFTAAAGIGVGNSAAATTPGTVVKKMEVFDAAGASLGFIPIYNAIT
jgi:hypothetical protein